MNDKNDFALVRKPSGAVEKAEPGARRIISGMVADTLALVKKPSLRIIILDDEPMLLELYELMIRGFCKEVTLLKFRDPTPALRELLREEPDLFITDMNHGGLEGREMLPLLARKKVRFPILVTSGTTDEETVKQCAGPELNVFYMWKPVQFKEFRTVFEAALKIPRNTASRDEAVSHKIAIDPAKLESWFQNGVSCFESKNYTEAVKWYRMAAEQNHANAQNNLACCYYNGDGVEKDYVEAVKWFCKAAEQGHADAQCDLGYCYAYSEGFSKSGAQDLKEGAKWFRKAAEQNHANGQFYLGLCYYQGRRVPKYSTEAVRWFCKAAEQGHGQAQEILAECYRDGWGVPQNMVEAAKWCRKLAEQGNWSAQLRLAKHYANGEGVAQDHAEAVKWYLKVAAEQDQAEAQNNLGVCYEKGHGVPLNLVEAYKFYKLATPQNQQYANNAYYAQIEKNAVENLKRIMTRMTAVEIAEGDRRVREFRSQKI